jgi:hypothetical protein
MCNAHRITSSAIQLSPSTHNLSYSSTTFLKQCVATAGWCTSYHCFKTPRFNLAVARVAHYYSRCDHTEQLVSVSSNGLPKHSTHELTTAAAGPGGQ